MATQKKVEELLVVLDSSATIKALLIPMLTQLDELKKEIETVAGIKASKEFNQLVEKHIENSMNAGTNVSRVFYIEHLSDDEVGQMIAFYSSPLNQRLRSLLPEMGERLNVGIKKLHEELTEKVNVFCAKHDIG